MSLRSMLSSQLARRSVAVSNGKRLAEHVLMALDDGSRISVIGPNGAMQFRLHSHDLEHTELVLEGQGGAPDVVLASGSAAQMASMREALSDQLLSKVRRGSSGRASDGSIVSGLLLLLALLLGILVGSDAARYTVVSDGGADGRRAAEFMSQRQDGMMRPLPSPGQRMPPNDGGASIPSAGPAVGGPAGGNSAAAPLSRPGGADVPAETPAPASGFQIPATGPLTQEQVINLARQVTQAIAANEPVPDEVLSLLPPRAAEMARKLIADRASTPPGAEQGTPAQGGPVAPPAPAAQVGPGATAPRVAPSGGAAPAPATPDKPVEANRPAPAPAAAAAPAQPADPVGANARGISNVPPEGSWLRVSPRTAIPIPGGGDLTTMDQVSEFGLKP